MSSQSYKEVDGMRALSHLSIIALHSVMLVSAHIPTTGKTWDEVKNNPMYTIAQMGGIQVDVMFMLSSFLCISSLLRTVDNDSLGDTGKGNEMKGSSQSISIVSYVIKRFVRMVPPLLVVAFVCTFLGEECNENNQTNFLPNGEYGASWLARVLSSAFFFVNYCDVTTFGSFSLTLFWSCCVDIQANTTLLAVMKWFIPSSPSTSISTSTSSSSKPSSTNDRGTVFAFRVRFVSFLLLLLSLYIRYSLYDKETLNLVKMGQYSHFGLVVTPSTYEWIKDHFQHHWPSPIPLDRYSTHYVNHMYQPTHTRFGPFTIGAILACNVFLANKEQYKYTSTTSPFIYYPMWLLGWIFTLMAGGQLILPCIPPSEEAPDVAQMIVTVAVRTLSATAASFLLYRCLVPSSHPWHLPFLSNILSSSMLSFVSKLSYCSYLIHFRLLLEMVFRKNIFSYFLPPFSMVDAQTSSFTPSSGDLIAAAYKLMVVGAAVSFVLSYILHYTVEYPCIAYFNADKKSRDKVADKSKSN